MREWLLLSANVFLLCFATLLLGTAQTSLWFQIFGWFPAPAFWIPALVYAALNRPFMQMTLLTFLMSLVLLPMTVIPNALLFLLMFVLGCSVRLVKRRFYWAGSSYFMMVCGITALVFHIYHWLGSMVIGDSAVSTPEISDWLVQSLLTPLIAPILYEVFRWFDRLTEYEQPSEASADII